MKMHTFWFECTDNGGGHQAFEVRATDKQEAIKKGMVAQRGNGKSLSQLEIVDSLMKRRFNYENR